MTLIEMLVACGLFLVFIGLSGGLIVHMLTCYREGEAVVRPLQEARNAMGLMSSTIRSAINITAPPETMLANGTNFIQCEIYTDGTRNVRFLQAGNTIVFQECFPDLTVKSQKTLVTQALRLSIRKQPRDPIVTIQLDVYSPPERQIVYQLQTLLFTRMYR